MNVEIENLITAKNDVFKKHLKKIELYYTYKYKVLQCKLENSIESWKQSCYKRASAKLSPISTRSKCYWSLLKNVIWQENSCNSTPKYIIIII